MRCAAAAVHALRPLLCSPIEPHAGLDVVGMTAVVRVPLVGAVGVEDGDVVDLGRDAGVQFDPGLAGVRGNDFRPLLCLEDGFRVIHELVPQVQPRPAGGQAISAVVPPDEPGPVQPGPDAADEGVSGFEADPAAGVRAVAAEEMLIDQLPLGLDVPVVLELEGLAGLERGSKGFRVALSAGRRRDCARASNQLYCSTPST